MQREHNHDYACICIIEVEVKKSNEDKVIELEEGKSRSGA